MPVVIGTLVALPVAYYASRRRDRGSERRLGARTLMHLSSLLYTIPSIALFVLMPLILGTSIISPLNVLVALSVYSFSLMVRSGVDAFDSVPDSVHESARALGYTPRQALMELYLPLATPRHYGGNPRGNRGKYCDGVRGCPHRCALARYALHRWTRAQYPFGNPGWRNP